MEKPVPTGAKVALQLHPSVASDEAVPASSRGGRLKSGGDSLPSVNRNRFVRTISVLIGLLVAALIVMMILLPDRLSRVAEIFLH